MTADPRNVLAGLSGLNGPFDLAWVADYSASLALPTSTSVALDAAFNSLGIVSADGVTGSTTINTSDIDGFGAFSPVRTLITSEVRTFKVTGRETNPTTLALKSRNKLTDVTPTGLDVSITEGPARTAEYAMVFHGVDGSNIVRKVCPRVTLTALDDEQLGFAQNLAYGFTVTAYPDATGVSVYSYYHLVGLS